MDSKSSERVNCQAAWAQGNETLFKFYHNPVNVYRKRCRHVYYDCRVRLLKDGKLKSWWKEVKRISGNTPLSDNKDIVSILAVETLILMIFLVTKLQTL